MDQWPSHFPSGLGLPSRPGILAGPSHSAGCPHSSPFLTLSSALSHLLTSMPTLRTWPVTNSSDKLIQAGMLDRNVSWAPHSSYYFLHDLWQIISLFWASGFSPVRWENCIRQFPTFWSRVESFYPTLFWWNLQILKRMKGGACWSWSGPWSLAKTPWL